MVGTFAIKASFRAAARRPIVAPFRTAVPVTRPAFTRFLSVTGGEAPKQPTSDSPQEGDVKSSRSTDSMPDKDGQSLQTPVSNPSAGQGQDEEGGDPSKKDPSKPADQKAKEVHEDGMKPMDAANK